MDECEEVGAFTARQRAWSDSMSLKTIAGAAVREPAPQVTLLRSGTVAKVDSMLGGEVVDCQQVFLAVGDPLDGLGELRPLELGERLDRPGWPRLAAIRRSPPGRE